MEGAWLARLRWRQRGAWLWPTFAVLTVVDGFLLHALPAAGSTQTLVGGIVAGMVFNVLAVLLLSRPRRRAAASVAHATCRSAWRATTRARARSCS